MQRGGDLGGDYENYYFARFSKTYDWTFDYLQGEPSSNIYWNYIYGGGRMENILRISRTEAATETS